MERRFALSGVLLVFISIMQLSCSTFQYLWPWGGVQISELNNPSLEKKILVASRRSEFKDALVGKIKEAFKDELIYVKFTGVEHLEKENGDDYSAVVVIVDSCMNWRVDSYIKVFLRRYKNQSDTIILSTFSYDYGEPQTRRYNLDAISSASEMHKTDEVAGKIIARTRSLLQKG